MTRLLPAIALALTAMGSACGRNDSRAADAALSTDLSLAAQQRGYTPLDSLSPAERARVSAQGLGGNAAPAAHRSTSSGEVTLRSTSAGSSSGSSASTASAPVATSNGGTVVKHGQRDAAIGAAAGAVLGATTSRNKVKGGLIGAAVGGILGGVIGNNVDKQKKP